MVLSVADEEVSVRLPNTATRYLIDPRNGDRLVSFTAEEAGLIAAALEARGLQDKAIDVLLGLQWPRFDGQTTPVSRTPGLVESTDPAPASLTRGEYCLHLDVNGAEYVFNLHGGDAPYVIDPISESRVVRFSRDDARAISDTLRSAGHSTTDILNTLLGLRFPDLDSRASGVISSDNPTIKPEPLEPGCNQCLNGAVCTYKGKTECCTAGGPGCQACKVCG